MDIKYILVEDVKTQDLEEILMNIANLYADTGFTDGIELYGHLKKENAFLVLFNNIPDFDRFSYFVNYIEYPEGFENLSLKVIGYSNLNEIPKKIEAKTGKWLMFYISKNDTEYDNVHIVTEHNLHYKFEFDGKVVPIEQLERKFERIELVKEDYNLIKEIIPSKKADALKVKPWWRFW